MTPRSLRITVDFDIDGEAFAGRVTADGSVRGFSGLLGLFTVIEGLVAEDGPGDRPEFDSPSDRPPPSPPPTNL